VVGYPQALYRQHAWTAPTTGALGLALAQEGAPCAAAGWAEASSLLTSALADLVYGRDTPADDPAPAASAAADSGRGAPRLQTCALLNASVCGPSVALTRSGRGLAVAVYNPLGWPRAEGVRVPVSLEAASKWAVTGAPCCQIRRIHLTGVVADHPVLPPWHLWKESCCFDRYTFPLGKTLCQLDGRACVTLDADSG